jgi:pimeloyl-ACP methyl ester carboxylesterase
MLLNRFHHFRAEINGLNVHYIHERGKGPRPMPLIITHGWPGSFAEMSKLIPMLIDPAWFGADAADAFDVVVPSMPGFGFSDRPTRPGMNVWRIADLWAELMAGFGYRRYGAQGGDFGAGVSAVLGLNHASHLIGVHLNYIPGSDRPAIGPGTGELAEEEQRFLNDVEE